MEYKKHFSSIALASLLFAQLSTGTIGIFEPLLQRTAAATNNTVLPQSLFDRVLSSLPANMPSTFTIAPNLNPWSVVGEVNNKFTQFGLTTIPINYGALGHEGTTLRAVCNLFGYETVQSSETVWSGDGRSNFSSCGDNAHYIWNGSNISSVSGCSYNWTSSIVCGTPLKVVTQCNDGIDNDNDGAADLQDFSCGNDPNRNDETNPKAQCQDGQDNDQDGLIDAQDPGCENAQDNTETNPNGPQCDNGRDDDGDGKIDMRDPGCSSPGDTSEDDPQCADGRDNDSDGATDAADASCHSDLNPANAGSYQPTKNDEALPKTQCQDGQDNDQDGLIDAQDPGCENAQDNTETNPNGPQCDNGRDDDGDGKIDMRDPGCSSPGDTTEQDTPQCQDGIDNDNDGAIDLQDFSCSGSTDNDETNPKAQCQDGADNDGDGLFDFPQDPGCDSLQDNSEDSEPIPSVSLRINGQHGTVSVNAGSPYTISWTSTGVQRCNTGNSNMPGWGRNQTLPVTGSVQLTATDTGVFGIMCSKTPTSSATVQDSVGITVVQSNQCSDGVDNDNDGAIDAQDFSCSGSTDNDETNPRSQCQDGQDNDQDGLTDFPQDPGCESKQDNTETNPNGPQCDNGRDDDGDGRIDMRDPGCSSPTDTTEQDTGQCQDNIDNDNDGVKDKQDPDCHMDGDVRNDASYDPSRNENGTNGVPACQNGRDDDGDGQIDFANVQNNRGDPDCQSIRDNDENNRLTIVKNGPASVEVGGLLNYTVTIRNSGSEAEQDLIVGDAAPTGGVLFVPFDPQDPGNTSSPECTSASFGATVLCDFFTLNPGASRTYRIFFRLRGNFDASPVYNQAELFIGDAGPTLEPWLARRGIISNQVQTTILPATADLAIEKTGPSQILRGTVIQYNVRVSNAGPKTARAVVVTDQIPNGLTFNQAQSSQECRQTTNNLVACDPFDLAPGNRQFTLAFNVPPIANCTTSTIQNVATVSSATTDPATGNNQSQATTQVHCPEPQSNLSILKTAQQSSVTEDGVMMYTITAHNAGPDTAGSVVITDQVPQGLTFQPAQSDGACALIGASVVCQNFSLSPGQSRNFQVSFLASPVQQTCSPRTIHNSATISSSSQDPVPSNNTSQTVSTQFECATPQFTIAKTASVQTPAPGDIVSYTILVKNTGSVGQSGIRIVDAIPSGTTFAPGNSTSGCSDQGNGTVACQPRIFQPQQQISYALAFRIAANAACSSVIPNIATVQKNGTDIASSQPANVTVTCPIVDADLFVTNSAPSSTPFGSTVTNSISVANLGPATATNVILTDTVPAGMTLMSATGGNCSLTSSTQVSCTLGSVTTGNSQTIQLTYRAPDAPQNCTPRIITNTAAATASSPDPNNANNSASTNTTLTCPVVDTADISIVKIGTTPTVTRGSTMTYNAVVSNAGPSNATNVVFVDQIPTGFTFMTHTSNANCSLSQNQVTCTLGALNAGSSQTISLAFHVPLIQNCSPMTATNRVEVSSTTADPNTGNNTSSVATSVLCPIDMSADISIVKFGPQTIVRGTNITYSLIATNFGPAAGQNIVISDPIPAGLTFVSSSGASCSVVSGALRCTIASLGAGQSTPFITATFSLPVIANCSAGTITNTATISTTNPDPVSTNNQSTVQTQVSCPTLDSDLSVVKTGPQTIVRGTNATYNLTVTNNGTSTVATNYTVTDAVPAGLAFVPQGSSSNCSLQGSNVICTGSLGFGPGPQSTQLTLVFSAPVIQNCTASTITNTATVSGSNNDPQTGNNVSSATMTLTCPVVTDSDVSVVKFGPQTAVRGTNITYSLIATNFGPAAGQNIVISDPIPAGLTFVSSSGATCSVTGGNLQCTIASLGAGQSTPFITATFSLPVIANCSAGTVTNTATISASGADPVTTNNTSTVQTAVSCPTIDSDLSVQKTGPASVVRGTNAQYTVTVTNNGTSTTATNFAVTDAVPAGLAFVPQGSSSNCSLQGSNVICTGSLGFGPGPQSTQLTLVFSAPVIQNCTASTITNTATVSGSNNDPQTGNNVSGATTQLTCPVVTDSDVSIVKFGPQTIVRGTNITYSLIATNFGPAAGQNIVISDPIPAGLMFVSSSGAACSVVGSTLQCTVASLPAGQSTPFITATFSVPMIQNCTTLNITNTATISASGADPVTTNNTSTVQTNLTCPPPVTADLSIVKSTNQASVEYGGQITYNLLVTNNGPANVLNAVVTDTFPAGFTFVSALNATCTSTSTQAQCSLQLNSGGQGTITIILRAPNAAASCQPGTATNSSNITSQVQDPNLANNNNSVQTQLTCPVVTDSDVSIVKFGPQTIVRGTNITYSLIATNFGPAAGQNIVISDPIPAGLTFVSSSGAACSVTGGNLQCTIASLGAGQSTPFITATFSLPVIANCSAGTVTNTATISTTNPDPVTTNNTSTVQTAVSCPTLDSDLSVQKTGPQTIVRGTNVTYNLTVTNNGTSTTATNFAVTDAVPAGLAFVPQSSSSNCSLQGSSVVCTGSLGFGPGPQSTQLTLVFSAPVIQNCTASTITNSVTVSGSNNDPQTGNNVSSATTQLTCPVDTNADVSIVKTATAQSFIRGGTATYNVVVTNAGSASANAVTFVDQIPSGFTFATNTGNATCTATQSQVSCVLGNLTAGSSVTVSLAFNIPAIQNCTTMTATNRVDLTLASPDTNTANNSSSLSTPVVCPSPTNADLSITKTGTSSVLKGANFSYVITVANLGPTSASGVTVTDQLPQGVSFVGALFSPVTSGASCTAGTPVTCTIPVLASGASRQITLTVKADESAGACTQMTVSNTVTVSETDPTVTDPNMTNNMSSPAVQTTILCTTSDLSVTKSGPSTLARGNNLTYTLNVTNNGPSTLTNTYTVTDAIPTGLTFVPQGSSANCSLQSSNIVCTGSIINAQTVPLTLVFTAPIIQNCSASTITNTATVAGQLTDPLTANNTSATVSTSLTCPVTTTDLSVTKTGPTTVVRGTAISYSIVATNTGPLSATNVVVTDSFSTEFTYASASGATCTVNGNLLTCTLGTLTSGQSTTVTVNFTVKTITGSCSTTTVSNTAIISSDTSDSNTANNTSSAVSTQLTCNNGSINDISVQKTDNRSTANVLDRVRYSIILTNGSNRVVSSLLVTDNMPYGLTILTVSDGGTVSSQQVRWTDISVPANSSRTLYIDAEVRSDIGNGAVITNTVDVNGKQVTDQTTIYNNTNVNPPYYPPVYNPPPTYYPPTTYPPAYNNPPPVYYPQTPAPVYYPDMKGVVYPKTGERDSSLFDAKNDDSRIVPVTKSAPENTGDFSAVFLSTLVALLAAGTAAASKLIRFGL